VIIVSVFELLFHPSSLCYFFFGGKFYLIRLVAQVPYRRLLSTCLRYLICRSVQRF